MQRNEATQNGVRPVFVLLLAVGSALVLLLAWGLMRQPSSAARTGDRPSADGAARAATAARRGTAMRPAVAADAGTPGNPVAATPPSAGGQTTAPLTEMERQWGVRFGRVGLSSDQVVTVSYSLTSVEQAASLSRDGTPAYLVDVASGVKIPLVNPVAAGAPVPAHSRARSAMLSMWHAGGSFPPPPSRAETGRVYAVLLPNLQGALKNGGKVAIVVGDIRTAEITVE
jgi:hypothetical protein